MRICLVNNTYHQLGGVEAIVRGLAEGLAESGHDVHLVTFADVPYEIKRNSSINFHRLSEHNIYPYEQRFFQSNWKKAIWQLKAFFNKKFERSLADLLTKIKPDIVHSHKLRGFPIKTWRIAKQCQVKRVVHTVHDFELTSPWAAISPLHAGRLVKILSRIYLFMVRKYASDIDVLTAPSGFLCTQTSKVNVVPAKKLKVVPNFPDVIQPKEKKYTPPGDFIYNMLYIGRISPEKGVSELCEAFSTLNSTSRGIRLRIVGDGPQKAYLQRRYSSEPNIEWSPSASGVEKLNHYLWTDVVVTPSQWEEIFSLTTLEALYCGRPVLATKRGGLPELVVDNKTGWLVTEAGVEPLRVKIQALLEQSPDLSAMAVNCQKRASMCSRDEVIRQYINCYKAQLNDG